jgi:hypothetical protein
MQYRLLQMLPGFEGALPAAALGNPASIFEQIILDYQRLDAPGLYRGVADLCCCYRFTDSRASGTQTVRRSSAS